MQAADLRESPLAAVAALPCGRSCWLRGWCTRVLRQVWQAKECAWTLARYCACQLVCVCRSLIAAFRCAGVISFSKPFSASRKVVSPPRGPLEQAKLSPAMTISDAANSICLNMSPIEDGEIVQALSVSWHPRITALLSHFSDSGKRAPAKPTILTSPWSNLPPLGCWRIQRAFFC